MILGHPGVLGAPLELDDACIGLMAVKKTREAVYLYFAHNSESFVSCTISRIKLLSCHLRSRLSSIP